jgi:hypothetical protein
MSEFQTRSSESSWGLLFDMTINTVNQNFIASYGRVLLPDLTTHVNTFIDTGLHRAQNDHQLFHCLAKSVNSATTELMQANRPFYMAGVARNVESSRCPRHRTRGGVCQPRMTSTRRNEGVSEKFKAAPATYVF